MMANAAKRTFVAAVAGVWLLAAPAAFAQHEHSEETTHESTSGGHGDHGPKPINWFDFSNKEQPPYAALAINFVILIAIYVRFGKKPLAEALTKRRDEIAKEIEEAQRIKREAEARAAMYQDKLGKLEQELVEARQALVEAGKGERDRIIREAEEKAVRMTKDAEFLIEQEIRQMKVDLQRSTVELAVTAAEELLRKRITPSDQERLAEEYLADIGTRAPIGRGGAA